MLLLVLQANAIWIRHYAIMNLMKQKKTNQAGFSLIEIVVVITIVALACAVGYMVMSHHKASLVTTTDVHSSTQYNLPYDTTVSNLTNLPLKDQVTADIQDGHIQVTYTPAATVQTYGIYSQGCGLSVQNNNGKITKTIQIDITENKDPGATHHDIVFDISNQDTYADDVPLNTAKLTPGKYGINVFVNGVSNTDNPELLKTTVNYP
jgi:prepilin-type N-terminal cleavage/methylation domain-containing protein